MIAHLDMDAFFASVELLRHPELRGLPVVVGGSHPRAVVAAASYESRRFGVHSALPMAIAMRRCPRLVVLAPDMDHYRRISAEVMGLLGRYSDRVEVAGLDEAYLDLHHSAAPKARARALKAEVRRTTGLACSIGLGPNKLVAKIASDLDKPDGFAVVRAGEFLARVGSHPARILPGVGPKTAERLAGTGIETVAQLAGADPALLEARLGSHGPALAARARGLDDRPVEPERERKSESRETTFPADITDPLRLEAVLAKLAADVAGGLAAKGLAGRTVTIKLRLAPFRTFTRSRTVAEPIADPERLAGIGIELLRAFGPAEPVRLIGIGLSSLCALAGPAAEPGASMPEPGGQYALELPF